MTTRQSSMTRKSRGVSLPSGYTKAPITRDFYQEGQELYRHGQLGVISSLTYLQGLKCKDDLICCLIKVCLGI